MKTYHYVVGIIFALVALTHLIRIMNHWPLVVGSWDVPVAISWAGLIITGILSIWSFRLIQKA
jgi:hypothetical protein